MLVPLVFTTVALACVAPSIAVDVSNTSPANPPLSILSLSTRRLGCPKNTHNVTIFETPDSSSSSSSQTLDLTYSEFYAYRAPGSYDCTHINVCESTVDFGFKHQLPSAPFRLVLESQEMRIMADAAEKTSGKISMGVQIKQGGTASTTTGQEPAFVEGVKKFQGPLTTKDEFVDMEIKGLVRAVSECIEPGKAAGEGVAKGNDLFGQKEWAAAYTMYTEAIAVDPDDAIIYSNRAAALLHLGHYEPALNDANKSISLDPTYIKAYMRKGAALFSLQRYEEAPDAYYHVQRLDPSSTLVKQELFKVQKAFKQTRKARTNMVRLEDKRAPPHVRIEKKSEEIMKREGRIRPVPGTEAYMYLEAFKGMEETRKMMKGFVLRKKMLHVTNGALESLTNALIHHPDCLYFESKKVRSHTGFSLPAEYSEIPSVLACEVNRAWKKALDVVKDVMEMSRKAEKDGEEEEDSEEEYSDEEDEDEDEEDSEEEDFDVEDGEAFLDGIMEYVIPPLKFIHWNTEEGLESAMKKFKLDVDKDENPLLLLVEVLLEYQTMRKKQVEKTEVIE
ncbi:hypothetical protein HK102_010374 [Quaeritorhiza haematococci]|nr:hypothetical protein HK102_010374 [Quaeritorhiza haematococci]